MLLSVCVAIASLQMCSGAEFDWCSLTCDGGKKHTMCVYKAGGGDSCKAVKRGMTAEEKQVILDGHNQLRAKVANGKETRGPQPSAADMNQLVWDDEVAEIAQRWVDQCEQPGGHDKCRDTRDKVKVGQNFAESAGYGMTVDRNSSIKEFVKAWYDEVKDMDPSLVAGIRFNGTDIGHYTQLVWGKTTRVGCGLAHKQEGKDGEFNVRLVCNYKIAGNFIGEPVYTKGETASKCAKKSTTYPGLCEPQEEGAKLVSDASAPSFSNGTSTNGTWTNGTSTNGTSTNGTWTNGTSTNGTWTNGTSTNNGTLTNGTWTNGTWTNGTWTDGTSTNNTSSRSKPDVLAFFGFDKPEFANFSDDFRAAFSSSGFPEGFAFGMPFHGNPSKK